MAARFRCVKPDGGERGSYEQLLCLEAIQAYKESHKDKGEV